MSSLRIESSVELPGSFTVLQGLPGDGLVNTMDEPPCFDGCPRDDVLGLGCEVREAIAQWNVQQVQNAKDAAAEWYHQVVNNPQQQEESKLQAKVRIPILFEYGQTNKKKWWIDPDTARLRIFSALPQPIPSEINLSGARTAPPGAICMGVALHTFEFQGGGRWSFSGSCHACDGGKMILPENHSPQAGTLQYLQIEAPSTGYILFSVDGYTVLAPGMADSTLFTGLSDASDTDPVQYWWWKVTCPAGAFVRQGVELTSKHVGTAPFGTHIQVTRKVVNAAGLSRLYIKAPHPNGGQGRLEGWCSELLNPMSGQRGPIVQPIPMAVPCLYRVVLRMGATVRKAVELGSPAVGVGLPADSIVPVVGRAYTEFPANACVPRVCLYSKHAYASLRLNRPSTASTPGGSESLIMRAVGECDSSFDPESPGLYHWKLHLKWTIETTDMNGNSSSSNGQSSRPHGSTDAKCVCCEDKEPNATLVHGETGHICCCLECARVCKAQGLGCPICRLPIDQVIMHFYS